MIKAWPYTIFLSLFCLAYGTTSLFSSTPFFVGSDHYSLQHIEWLYNFLGPVFTGITFLISGVYLSLSGYKEYITNEKDNIGLTKILLFKVIFVAVLIVGVIFIEMFNFK